MEELFAYFFGVSLSIRPSLMSPMITFEFSYCKAHSIKPSPLGAFTYDVRFLGRYSKVSIERPFLLYDLV